MSKTTRDSCKKNAFNAKARNMVYLLQRLRLSHPMGAECINDCCRRKKIRFTVLFKSQVYFLVAENAARLQFSCQLVCHYRNPFECVCLPVCSSNLAIFRMGICAITLIFTHRAPILLLPSGDMRIK